MAAFIKNWLSIFGVPKRLFSDNGGKFISDEFYEMCENVNIKSHNNAILQFMG